MEGDLKTLKQIAEDCAEKLAGDLCLSSLYDEEVKRISTALEEAQSLEIYNLRNWISHAPACHKVKVENGECNCGLEKYLAGKVGGS